MWVPNYNTKHYGDICGCVITGFAIKKLPITKDEFELIN